MAIVEFESQERHFENLDILKKHDILVLSCMVHVRL